MKLFISVLDNGYTLTVTHPAREAIPAGVDLLDRPTEAQPAVPERKEKFAYETQTALERKLVALGIVGPQAVAG